MFDVNCRYWQILIDDADNDKTPLTSHHGLYHFVSMLFGLRNARGTFQRTMDKILSGVKWQLASFTSPNGSFQQKAAATYRS